MNNHVLLDQLADEFETAWHQGKRPGMAMYLSRVNNQHRPHLAELLIPVDIEYRQKSGVLVEPEDYREMGEGFEAIAREALRSIKLPDALTDGLMISGPTLVRDKHSIPNGPSDDLQAQATGRASQMIGPYKLISKLGEGGMGEVWIADQARPVRRQVALKLIKAGLDNKQVIARFEAERQALALMDHQNIARVLDAGATDAGQPYFVMELVQGIPFTAYCNQHNLSIDDRLNLFVPVCNAVQHAHQKGIIHRDLKPTNVLVCHYDGKPVPKVIDFGLAKALQHTEKLTDKTMYTEFGQVVGTLQYMSPEQAELKQQDIDTRTDIYSLGVMLYELLTGSTPIDQQMLKDESILKVLQFIREKDPPRPSIRLSGISPQDASDLQMRLRMDISKLRSLLRGDLDWIVMRALEKDRTRRYETAVQLADDIGRYLVGDVVTARPPSTSYRVRKYVRRHTGLVASLSAIATLLIIGIVGATIFGIQSNFAKNDAIKQKKSADGWTKKAVTAQREAEAERDKAIVAEERLVHGLARANYLSAIGRMNDQRTYDSLHHLYQIPSSLRGLEWSYARHRNEGSVWTGFAHAGIVSSVIWSPDRNSILSIGHDQTLREWDARSGQLRATHRIPTDEPDEFISASASSDHRTLAIVTVSGKVFVWDVDANNLKRELTPAGAIVRCAAFMPDNRALCCGCDDGNVVVVDTSSGEALKTLEGHSGAVRSLTANIAGTTLASGGDDRSIRLWNLQDDGAKPIVLSGHVGPIHDVAFSPDGVRLASASDDRTIIIWNLATNEPSFRLEGHVRLPVNCLCFSPSGATLISGSEDNTIRLWEVRTGRLRHIYSGHFGKVCDLEFDDDGSHFVSVSTDSLVKVWDARTPNRERSLIGQMGSIREIAFDKRDERLASASSDGSIFIWSLETDSKLCELWGHDSGVWSVCFSPDGNRVASGSADGSIRIWDAQSGDVEHLLTAHQGAVRSVSLDPTGQWLVSGGEDSAIILWEQSGDAQWTPKKVVKDHADTVRRVSLDSTGNKLVAASEDRTVSVWTFPGLELIRRLSSPRKVAVSSACFSPDGAYVAMSCGDGNVHLFDISDGKLVRSFLGHRLYSQDVAFSPDGERLLTASEDSTVRLWDARTGDELLLHETPGAMVFSARFNSDGSCFALGLHPGADVYRRSLVAIVESSPVPNYSVVLDSGPLAQIGFAVSSKAFWGRRPDGAWVAWNRETAEPIENPVHPAEPNERLSRVSSDRAYHYHFIPTRETRILAALLNNQGQELRQTQLAAVQASEGDYIWNLQKAVQASIQNDWFTAMFHRSICMNLRPEIPSNFDFLHSANKRFEAQAAPSSLNYHRPEGMEWMPDVMRRALGLPKSKTPAPLTFHGMQKINNSIWEEVREPRESYSIDMRLLEQFQEGCERFPRGFFCNTLGVLHYRLANYDKCINWLNKSLEKTPRELGLKGLYPGDLAFLALGHLKLGQHEIALQFRQKFAEAIKNEHFATNEECLQFAKELDEEFQGVPGAAD